MKRFSMFAVAILAALSVSTFAPSKTSFAGKWTIVAEPNAPAGRGGRGGFGGLGQEFSAAQMGEQKVVYNLDGTESKNPITFNGTPNESTQTSSLDASGNLLVESTSNFGGNGPTTTKTTYKNN